MLTQRLNGSTKLNKMTASDILIKGIKRFEGLRLKAYQDAKGVWTIGYGHTAHVKPGDKITVKEAEAFLRQDLAVFENYVNSLGVCDGNQGRFDALTDFAYNCGIENLKSSTLLKCIRKDGSEDEIRREFLRWIYSGNKKLKGLKKRRMWEADRYFNKKSSTLDDITGWLKTLYYQIRYN